MSDNISTYMIELEYLDSLQKSYEQRGGEYDGIFNDQTFIKYKGDNLSNDFTVNTPYRELFSGYEREFMVSAYVKPNYSGQNYNITSDQYSLILKKLKLLDGGDLSTINSTALFLYRNAILTQVERQNNELKLIWVDISNILKKVYVNVKKEFNQSETISSPNNQEWIDFTKLIQLFVSNFWSINADEEKLFNAKETIFKTKFIPRAFGLESKILLFKKIFHRSALINVIKKLFLQLEPLESIIEDLILDRDIKNVEEYTRVKAFTKLPDPEEIAFKFVNDPKPGKVTYSSKVISKALVMAREHIYKNNLESLKRHFDPLSNEIKKVIPELKNTDTKTISNWLEFYEEERLKPLSE